MPVKRTYHFNYTVRGRRNVLHALSVSVLCLLWVDSSFRTINTAKGFSTIIQCSSCAIETRQSPSVTLRSLEPAHYRLQPQGVATDIFHQVSLQGTPLVQNVVPPSSGGGIPLVHGRGYPLWTDTQTENISFPTLRFAGGKNMQDGNENFTPILGSFLQTSGVSVCFALIVFFSLGTDRIANLHLVFCL